MSYRSVEVKHGSLVLSPLQMNAPVKAHECELEGETSDDVSHLRSRSFYRLISRILSRRRPPFASDHDRVNRLASFYASSSIQELTDLLIDRFGRSGFEYRLQVNLDRNQRLQIQLIVFRRPEPFVLLNERAEITLADPAVALDTLAAAIGDARVMKRERLVRGTELEQQLVRRANGTLADVQDEALLSFTRVQIAETVDVVHERSTRCRRTHRLAHAVVGPFDLQGFVDQTLVRFDSRSIRVAGQRVAFGMERQLCW